MHRADQILTAIAERLRASTTLGIAAQNVYEHRTLSLDEDEGETPAAGVDIGDDEPNDDFTELRGEIGSDLEVIVTVCVTGDEEADVKADLLQKRAEVHKAIDYSSTLGLPFVALVVYGGAKKPVIDSTGERVAGCYELRTIVTYQMNPDDPS